MTPSTRPNTTSQSHLFTEEELNQCAQAPEGAASPGPVTCLGRTFPNDEARRAYFREELRKKLPELRKIEGLPIGEDDDIINLSDPPYYTACPNPWLNDFIAEWEQDKLRLEAEGKRSKDFEVKEPYASDVSEGKNNPVYVAHTYHTKVPHPAIMRYILHYTQPGDIVFDGFCGTGMTGVAANMCGDEVLVNSLSRNYRFDVRTGIRHGVCSDISPIASLISASYCIKFDPLVFEVMANNILKQADDELGWMYETLVDGKKARINNTIWSDVVICPSCGKEIVLWDNCVSADTETIRPIFDCPNCGVVCHKRNMRKAFETKFDDILDSVTCINKVAPVRINYTLNGNRGEKCVDQGDIGILSKVNAIDVSKCSTCLIPIGDESKRLKELGITHFHQIYTKRNFLYLSLVFKLVRRNPILLAWFTSSALNTSRMYKFRTDRKGGLLNGTLFVPSLSMENSPYNVLKNKISDFKRGYYYSRNGGVTSIASACALHLLKGSSIDYIFIDPPFGSNLMYSELNSIWEGWIKLRTNTEDEAVVSRSQGKGLPEYQLIINRSFKEFYRILKPGKWMTIEFSNTSAAVWNSIQNALQGVGFVVTTVASLDKKQGSFKAVTTTTAVKQDLVITCYKPTEELIEKFEHSSDKVANVWDFVSELLDHLPVHLQKGNKTTAIVERSPKILYDRLIAYYVQHGYPVPMDARKFQAGLRERYIESDGMFFTPAQAVEYDQKKAHAPEMLSLAIIVSNEVEGIEWLKRELQTPKTYQDIQPSWLQSLGGVRKGDKLPELEELLEENLA